MTHFRSIAAFLVFLLVFQKALAEQPDHDRKCLVKAIYSVQRTTDFLQFLMDQELLSRRSTLSAEDVLDAIPAGQEWNAENVTYVDYTGENRFMRLTLASGGRDEGLPSRFPHALRFGFGDDGVLSEIDYAYQTCDTTTDVNISDMASLATSDVDLPALYADWLKKSQLIQNMALRCQCLDRKSVSALAAFPPDSDAQPAIEALTLNLYQQVVALSIESQNGTDGQLLVSSLPVDDTRLGFEPVDNFSADTLNIRMWEDGTVMYFLPYHER